MATVASVAERSVVVTGVGRVLVVPDQVELYLGVAHESASPGEAFREAAEASQRLLALLEEAGLAPADRRTTGVSVHPSFGRGSSEPVGHEAQVSILARCADLNTAGALLDRLSRALEGSLRVHGLAWVVADPAPARAEASRAALAFALARARDLALGAELQLGQVRSIVEHPDVGVARQRVARASAGFAQSAGPAMEPGSHEVLVAVEVEVELA